MILTKPSPIELTGHDCHPDHLDPDELVAEHTPRHQTDEPHATCEPALTILMNRICEAHSNRTDHAVDGTHHVQAVRIDVDQKEREEHEGE